MFFFFKQKTSYEMRISDWSSDVCSSDLSGIIEAVVDLAVDARHAGIERADRLIGMEAVGDALHIHFALDARIERHLEQAIAVGVVALEGQRDFLADLQLARIELVGQRADRGDRKSPRLNSSP